MSIEEQSKCVDEKYRSSSLSAECAKGVDMILADEKQIEEEHIRMIASWGANSTEKRVIAFGLYGNKPKYVHGCLANIKLSKIYYPGWVCRFYVTNVEKSTIDLLRNAGGEVVEVNGSGPGHMMSRFMVADDPKVDRFIVRDVDSRLNSRERFAVQEWIESGLKIHSMRDHVNQFYEYNGGMWGGTKKCMPLLIKNIEGMSLEKKTEGMADILTLANVWKYYKNDTMAHDSYTCLKYVKEGHAHLRSFPTRRPFNYLHVGQVFNENDQPRMNDIDRFMRGHPVPERCRRHRAWIYA